MESYEKDREARCAHDDEVDYQTLDPKPGSSSRPLSSSRVFDALLPLSKDGFSAFHALLQSLFAREAELASRSDTGGGTLFPTKMESLFSAGRLKTD